MGKEKVKSKGEGKRGVEESEGITRGTQPWGNLRKESRLKEK